MFHKTNNKSPWKGYTITGVTGEKLCMNWKAKYQVIKPIMHHSLNPKAKEFIPFSDQEEEEDYDSDDDIIVSQTENDRINTFLDSIYEESAEEALVNADADAAYRHEMETYTPTIVSKEMIKEFVLLSIKNIEAELKEATEIHSHLSTDETAMNVSNLELDLEELKKQL